MTYKEWRKEHVEKPKEEAYNRFKAQVHEDIRSNYNLTVHQGRQDKHVAGTSNYIDGRSILTADAQTLIDLYAGKSEPLQIMWGERKGEWNQRERFAHAELIGTYIDKNGQQTATKSGIIRYSKTRGAHIVPSKPEKG